MYPGTQYLEIMRTSKKLASALLKAFEPRLSVSADDIRALKEKTVQIVVPSMTKVRSFEGEGQHCLGSPNCTQLQTKGIPCHSSVQEYAFHTV